MSAPELASRLVMAFGTDASVISMTAADLKAMGKPRSTQGLLYFSPTEQRESVQSAMLVRERGKQAFAAVSVPLAPPAQEAPEMQKEALALAVASAGPGTLTQPSHSRPAGGV